MRRAGQSAADHGAFSGLTLNHCEFGYHPIAPAKRLKRVDRSSDGISLRRALARDRETELIRVMVESIRYRRLAGGGSAGWRSGTRQFTDMVATAAGDASLSNRTWMLLTEAVEGGLVLAGHANTNAELIKTARTKLPSSSVQRVRAGEPPAAGESDIGGIP